MATAASLQTIQQFYVAYYGRPADPAGLEFWATQLDTAGGVLTAVLDAFGTSAEATTRYGTGTNDAKVTNLYQQILGRAPDTEGLRFYSDNLTNGTFTLATVAKRIVDGIPAGSTDATTLANKTTMANSFTDTLKTDTAANAGYSGDDAAARARTWLDAVRDTATTVTTAQTNLAATITDIKPVSLTLTTGQDKFTSSTTVAADKTSAVADTITGATSALTSGNTLNGGDVIDGGAGTDTLTVNLAANFDGFVSSVGSAKSIEVLNLINATPSDGTAVSRTFDASGITGVQTIKLDMNDKSFTLTDVNVGDLRLEVSNADAAGTLSLTVDALSDAADGSSDALTLVLNTVKSLTNVTAADFETLNVVSNGTNSTDLSIGDAKTITISGSGKLTVTGVDSTVTSVDASAATGAQTLDLSGITTSTLKNVKGGSASDVITVTGIAADVAISDGGGSADNLIFNGISGTKQPTVSGFETITLDNITAATTLAASKISGLSTVKISDGLSAAVTIADLSNSSLSIVLEEDDATWGGDGSGLTLTGTAALNISADTAGTKASTINTDITAANAASVDLTIGELITYSGDVSAAKATSATLTVVEDAVFSGTLTVAGASTVTLDIDGESSGVVTAAKATTVQIDLGENSKFTSEVSAAAATTVTVTSADTDDLTALDLRAAKATNVTISSASEIGFANTTDLSAIQRLTLTSDEGATTPAAALFGDASASVIVDATNVKGDLVVTIGDYASGTGSANVIGTSLGKNTVTIAGDRNEVTVTGGIGDDVVKITNAQGSTKEGTFRFDLGTTSTDDTVEFASTSNFSAATVVFAGVDVVNFGTSGDGTGSGTLKGASVTGQTIKFEATGGVTIVDTTAADVINLANITLGAGTGLTVTGGSGADSITGGVGAESLSGGSGDDVISGGSGNDTIVGGSGADNLTGGAGADVFYFAQNSSSTALANSAGTALTTAMTFATGNTINATGADIITDFGVGTGAGNTDLLTFDTTVFDFANDNAYDTYGTTPVDDDFVLIKGTYDSVTKIFTVNTSVTSSDAGYATLVVYDNTPGDTDSFRGIVLLGFVDGVNSNDASNDTTAPLTGLTGVGG